MMTSAGHVCEVRHSRGSGNPEGRGSTSLTMTCLRECEYWIPVFTGMTEAADEDICWPQNRNDK